MNKLNNNSQNNNSQNNMELLAGNKAVQKKVTQYLKKGKLRKVIAVLSAFVLLFTLNQLTFEADTLQRVAVCDYEVEHIHSKACFNEAGELICGLQEHEHTDACYQQRPVNPEPTVFDEFMDLNSQVVLASPSDEDAEVSVEDVDEDVSETTIELGDDGYSDVNDDSYSGLEVEMDLDDLYDEGQADDGNDEPSIDSNSLIDGDSFIDNEPSKENEAVYTMPGDSVTFLSDVLNSVGMSLSSITSVGEIVEEEAAEAHLSIEAVEGVDGEYALRVVKDFDRITLGVITESDIVEIALKDGMVAAATDAEGAEELEAVSDQESEGYGEEYRDDTGLDDEFQETVEPVIENEEFSSIPETTEIDLKQTEVDEEQTEVGNSDLTEEAASALAEGDSTLVGATSMEVEDEASEDEVSENKQSEDAEVDDANGDASADEEMTGDSSAIEDAQGEEATDVSSVKDEDEKDGDAQSVDSQSEDTAGDTSVKDEETAETEEKQDAEKQDADEGEQTDEEKSDEEQTEEDQTDDEAKDPSDVEVEDAADGQTEDEQQVGDGSDEEDEQQGDAEQSEDEQQANVEQNEAEQTVIRHHISLDFSAYIVADSHTVYLYDDAMNAVLVNTAEIDSVDGVVVTTTAEEVPGEKAEVAEAEEAPVAEEEQTSEVDTEAVEEQPERKSGVLVITGDGEYTLDDTIYTATGLVLPGTEEPSNEEEAPTEVEPSDEEEGVEEEAGDEESSAADQTPVMEQVIVGYKLEYDLAEVEAYPLSLRGLMAQAEPVYEEVIIESDVSADDNDSSDEEETADGEEVDPTTDAEAADENTSADTAIDAEVKETTGDATSTAEEAVLEETVDSDAEVAGNNSETVEYDDALIAVEQIDEDWLITPAADFEATEIVIGLYEITLLNGKAPITYPAVVFDDSTEYINVHVEASEGAFPEGTTMHLEDVVDEQALAEIGDAAVTEENVEVQRVHAVDITFRNKAGQEIEPRTAISVVMTLREIEKDEETVVVHMDDEGNINTVAVDAAPTDAVLPAEDADQTATDVVETEEETVQSAEESSAGSVAFTTDAFSIYAMVVTKKIETRYIAASGEAYNITLTYGPEAMIPDEATLSVSEVTGVEAQDYLEKTEEALDTAKQVTSARFFDIKIMVGDEEIQPATPVKVQVVLEGEQAEDATPCAVHFESNDGEESEVPVVVEATEKEDAVEFHADSFSVWGVVYTVDFYYNVDGRIVEYHITGGSVQSLRMLLPLLEIVEDDPETEADEVLKFVEDIEKVEFSDERLVKPVPVIEDATAGNIVDMLGVEIEYSGKLTEEDIAEIQATPFTTPDWALVSLKPFTTEEYLTITLKNGELVRVKVTDEAAVNPNTYIGKQVIIYDNGEQRAMTSNWEQNEWRTQFNTVPVDGADSNAAARWTVVFNNGSYYLKASNGKYLGINEEYVWLADTQGQATALTIEAGSNPDYCIYPNDKSRENALAYCTNGEYDGFFSTKKGTYNNDCQQWLYIREAAVSQKKHFSVDVATWTANGNRWGKLNSKYFGRVTVNGKDQGVDGDRYPASGTAEGKLGNDGLTYFNFGFGAVPNDGYELAFWAYQANGLYRQLNAITNTTIIPNDPTEYYAFFTEKGRSLFIYQSEDTSKGTVNRTYGYSDDQGATATPQYGYQFIGWYDSGNSLISLDATFSTNSSLKSKVLTAKFIVPSQVSINISVNDTNGGDVVVTNNGQESSYCGDQYTKESGLLNRTITAQPKEGYTFCYWTINGERTSLNSTVLSYDPSKGPTPYFQQGDRLQAVFKKTTLVDANESAHSTIHVDTAMKEKFERWLASLESDQTLSANKTAQVSHYDNRIYQVQIDAASARVKADANIGMAFILDASNSMQFPASLQRTGKTMTLTQSNLNNAFGDSTGPYYIISDPRGTSTVIRIYKENGIWYSIDASYYYSPQLRAEKQIAVDWDFPFVEVGDNKTNVPLAYPIYVDGGIGKRADYLNDGLHDTINTMRSIVNKVNKSDYDIKVAYTMFCAFTPKQYGSDVVFPNGFEWKDFNSLKNDFTVDMGDTGGGTRQDLGLQDALSFSWDSIPEGQRYAILITDGASVVGSKGSIDNLSLEEVRANIFTQAAALKAKGVKLITVGLSTRNVVGGSNIMSEIASDNLFFEAESGEDLQNILYEIVQTVVKNATSAGKIIDEVDEAFYPVKADGTPIRRGTSYYDNEGNEITKEAYDAKEPWGSRYKWEETNGKWKITWENQYIGWNPVDTDSRKQPWHGTFYVKAKENFLGGNTIKTNDDCTVIEEAYNFNETLQDKVQPDQWILLNDPKPSITLPTPYVNVDELALTQNSTEWTVYLGTEVDPLTQLKDLYGKIDVLKVVSGSTDQMITEKSQMLGGKSEENSERFKLGNVVNDLNNLAVQEWQTLISGDTVSKSYSHYGHENVGQIQIKLTKNQTATGEKGLNPSPHETEIVGNGVEQYTFTVTYVPTAETDPTGGWHTTAGGFRGEVTGNMESENSHVVNVFAKGLKIEKKDTENQIIEVGTAKFQLYRGLKSGEEASSTLTVGNESVQVIPVGEEIETVQGIATLPQLPYAPNGTYYLVETEAPGGYAKRETPAVITLPLSNSYWPWNTAETSASETWQEALRPYNWRQTLANIACDGTNLSHDDNDDIYVVGIENPPVGALMLTKVVTINGKDNTSSLTDGTYTFTISGINDTSTAGQSHTLSITFVNGRATSYQIDENETVNVSSTDNSWSVVVTDLVPGDYLINETTNPTNTNPLKFLNAVTDGKTYTTDGVTVTVAPGKNTESVLEPDAQVVYTNNKDVVDIDATKTWRYHDGVNPYGTIKDVSVKFTLQSRAKMWSSNATNDTTDETSGETTGTEPTVDNWTEWADVTGLDATLNGYTETVTLPLTEATDPWTVAWTNLPKYNDNGQLLQYRVREYDAKLADIAIPLPEDPTGVEREQTLTNDARTNPYKTISLINTLPKTSIEVTKEWKDSHGEDRVFTNKSIDFTLYQQVGSGTPTVYTTANGVDSNGHGTITYHPAVAADPTVDPPAEAASAHWDTVTISNLPKYVYVTGDGGATGTWELAKYYVVEDSISGVSITYTVEDDPDETGYTVSDSGDSTGFTPVTPTSQSEDDAETGAETGTGDTTGSTSGNDANAPERVRTITITNTDEQVDLVIVKADSESILTSSSTPVPLSGAAFELLRVQDDNATLTYPRATAISPSTNGADNLTGADGLATFSDLAAGYYKVTETQAPAGYILTNSVFYIKVDTNSIQMVEWVLKEGSETEHEWCVRQNADPRIWFTAAPATSDSNLTGTATVGNEKGVALPSTGGPGTTLFYVVGSIITLLAAVLLITKRRSYDDD